MKKYKQLDLWTPVSRSSDPGTSHEAEKSINKDSTSEKNGLTTGEIGQLVGNMDGWWKRLSDLKNLGLILQGTPKVWSGTGRKQSTWWPRGE
mgnify:CR=1 FL=1